MLHAALSRSFDEWLRKLVNIGVLLRANPPKDGDAELRGYRAVTPRHARRAASITARAVFPLAAFSCPAATRETCAHHGTEGDPHFRGRAPVCPIAGT